MPCSVTASSSTTKMSSCFRRGGGIVYLIAYTPKTGRRMHSVPPPFDLALQTIPDMKLSFFRELSFKGDTRWQLRSRPRSILRYGVALIHGGANMTSFQLACIYRKLTQLKLAFVMPEDLLEQCEFPVTTSKLEICHVFTAVDVSYTA